MITTTRIRSVLALLFLSGGANAQSLGNAGTVLGIVRDSSNAVVGAAQVSLSNPISGYKQNAASGPDGTFRLINIPPNAYHLEVSAPGFAPYTADVAIRSSVPLQFSAILKVAGSVTEVTVESAGMDLLENEPTAHVDVDRNLLAKLPQNSPGSGLSDAITNTTGGVAADANGFFHPQGDHAEVAFVVDNQPISDQQSKVFSTQLPTSAIQSMEITTGTPAAEFGDKTSLVAQITTRSGLGVARPFGSVETSYGTFGNVTGDVAFGFGGPKYGNFIALDGSRSGRFLDSPERTSFHDIGNNETIFDRFDYEPSGRDAIHLNLFTARNWIQIPNSYDQLGQDQRQRVVTWNIAPGYQHTFNSTTLLTVNPYIRKDEFLYYGSRDPFQDTPFTSSQARQLLNYGLRADLAVVKGRHNVKLGIDLKQTRLREDFGFGVTDRGYNTPGEPGFLPGLLPYDLSRGGTLFSFHGTKNINQYAAYLQDSIKVGDLQISLGLRGDQYNGISTDGGVEPRAGLAYHVKRTGTVLRASYARTFETPFNENLILSSATGSGGLAENVFGAAGVSAIRPGRRNQFNTGLQQAIGRYFLVDVDYFWKYTHNAYDFSTLFNTTITFPISWHNSKNDGVTGRISTTNLKGFQAFYSFGHTRARYFPPQDGGVLPNDVSSSVFRIDHDQVYQSNANFRYQRPKNAEWVSFIWRYDSGLVVSGVPNTSAALALSPAQQSSLGLRCGGGQCLSNLIDIPTDAASNPDHNPARVKPRSVFNLAVGTDNLLHKAESRRIIASVTVSNLTDKTAVYNFLSTFSGTHFIQPRTVTGHIGFVF